MDKLGKLSLSVNGLKTQQRYLRESIAMVVVRFSNLEFWIALILLSQGCFYGTLIIGRLFFMAH